MKSFDGLVEAFARLDSKSRLFARCRFSKLRLEVENFGDLSPNPEDRTGLGPVIKGVNESSREFDTDYGSDFGRARNFPDLGRNFF